MNVSFQPVNSISATTLDDYNQNASGFRAGTWNHDVSQNINALLRHIQAQPPYRILDFGCGPGRDLAAFKSLGHIPVGLDGSSEFVSMARESSGCEVWHQDFLSLALPSVEFDGVFANASLFHVPGADIARVLKQLHRCLKPGGVLLSSNPRGGNQEGWNGARYGVYHDLTSWRRLLDEAGFIELEHYYRPEGLPREQQPWLVTVWRKPD
ncbi:MAG TPA: methyltransferase domain-containing protein [Pusillimonas sp.]|uniref:class I SAM-dependent DNA methyltransferase n=1 Tax=unclassified Pusillimonas TaxID=2640016 RepID=UPI00261759D8|nr:MULTISPECIES: class I SAM-dependent methyltransferase [unclassified Pusillimonas]HLU19503.1 methyltransferase domain-containing protein [Pusillimonas sp.]